MGAFSRSPDHRSARGTATAERREPARLATELVEHLGGRFSSELGIDVDGGDGEVERWFLAATLFGTRISVAIAERTFHELAHGGVERVSDAAGRSWDELVSLLDAGGYVRYDFRTATRLQALARVIADRHEGSVAAIGRRCGDPSELYALLDALPGWGPVTIGLFLRELRGLWPGAALPLDPEAEQAARHLGLLPATTADALQSIGRIARQAGIDPRDLEAALVRLARDHRRRVDCPGGARCVALGGTDPPHHELGRHRARQG